MNRKDFYEMLTTILDINSFTFDDDNNRIKLGQKFTWEQIVDFKKAILSFLGNPHTPNRKWEDDPAHWGYKFDSHYIEIDEKTIKVDNTGRLYADLEEIIHIDAVKSAAENALLNDEKFIQKVVEKILPKLLVEVPLPPQHHYKPGHAPGAHHHDPNYDDD